MFGARQRPRQQQHPCAALKLATLTVPPSAPICNVSMSVPLGVSVMLSFSAVDRDRVAMAVQHQ